MHLISISNKINGTLPLMRIQQLKLRHKFVVTIEKVTRAGQREIHKGIGVYSPRIQIFNEMK